MKLIHLLILLFISAYSLTIENDKDNEECELITHLPSRDSIFINPVYFGSDTNSKFYYSSVQTSVCNDTLCQLVNLKLFWDLAGHYVRFDTFPGYPLTKNDHLLFKSQDYLKLHNTLGNRNSILGERTEKELIDKSQTRYSKKIDAVTGATAKEIKSAVVDGALYSTYTLWHLVNGDIQEKLQQHTLSILTQEIENHLLNSDNPQTLLFALKNMDDNTYVENFDNLINIMKRADPLVNFYLAKKFPEEVFENRQNRETLLDLWDKLDRNTQSVLADYLNK